MKRFFTIIVNRANKESSLGKKDFCFTISFKNISFPNLITLTIFQPSELADCRRINRKCTATFYGNYDSTILV